MMPAAFNEFDRAFKWGASDCAQFVRSAVRDAHGVDFMADFPKYTSERAAARLIDEHGGLYATVVSILGTPMAWPDEARNGDVGLVHVPGIGLVLAFVWLGRPIIKTATGITDLPAERLRIAWRVGEWRR